VRRPLSWLTYGPVRLTLLLVLLMTLAVYALSARTGVFGATGATAGGGVGVGTSLVADCPSQTVPSVEIVSRATLRELREDLRGVMFGRQRRLYEQGVATPRSAWSDNEPGKHTSLPAGARDPGGYEMRWWSAGNDDVVTDVFVFAGTSQARAFFESASNARCRTASTALAASSPPGGRDLVWRNPDGFAQEDVYLLRGRRVYRVAVVLARSGTTSTAESRKTGFSFVNELACALPEAACRPQSDRALAQQTLSEQLTFLRRLLPGGEAQDTGLTSESACANVRGVSGGGTGSAYSEPLHYGGNALTVRLGIRVYASDSTAKGALADVPTKAGLGCVARFLVSALHKRHYHAGIPSRRLLPSAPGTLVGEVEVPFASAGRPYTLVFDDVAVTEGRFIDGLDTLAPTTKIRFDEHLAAQLRRIGANEQR
jgi:hypothetical protein